MSCHRCSSWWRFLFSYMPGQETTTYQGVACAPVCKGGLNSELGLVCDAENSTQCNVHIVSELKAKRYIVTVTVMTDQKDSQPQS